MNRTGLTHFLFLATSLNARTPDAVNKVRDAKKETMSIVESLILNRFPKSGKEYAVNKSAIAPRIMERILMTLFP